jgi:hypothetical protein
MLSFSRLSKSQRFSHQNSFHNPKNIQNNYKRISELIPKSSKFNLQSIVILYYMEYSDNFTRNFVHIPIVLKDKMRHHRHHYDQHHGY